MKVQIQNPKSKRWVLVDKEKGEIVSYHRKPLKNVPEISYLNKDGGASNKLPEGLHS